MAENKDRPAFDLEERTALFGETVVAFAKKVPVNQVTKSLIDQLVRSGTSVGANYCEADDASSKKEFRPKDRLLPQGSTRDETLAADDRQGRAGTSQRGRTRVAGSERTPLNLRHDSPQVVKLGHSSFVIP
jgi:hypothetical protein